MCPRLELPKGYETSARHTSRKGTASKPDQLQSCPQIVDGVLRELRFGPTSAKIGQDLANIGKSWPSLTKFDKNGTNLENVRTVLLSSAKLGMCWAQVGQCWSKLAKMWPANVGPGWSNSDQILPNWVKCVANVCRIRAKSRLRELRFDNCWATVGQIRSVRRGLEVGQTLPK